MMNILALVVSNCGSKNVENYYWLVSLGILLCYISHYLYNIVDVFSEEDYIKHENIFQMK